MKLKRIIILFCIFLISFSFAGCEKNGREKKAIGKYLKENFPAPEKESDVIYFSFTEDKEFLFVSLYFKESITKKEMINAIIYTEKQINLFHKSSYVIQAGAKYTDDGEWDYDMYERKGKIKVYYHNMRKKEGWEIETHPGKWEAFNPDDIDEEEPLEDFTNEIKK